jgi:predicted transcriptional regulator
MSNKYQPSEAEMDILHIIWERQPISVREVHEALLEKKQVGYTTTLKQIQRMTEKGMLKKLGSGKSHQYEAVVQEEKVKQNLFQKFVNNTFKGSAMKLMMHALGNSEASKEEIEELEAFLKQQKSKNND